MNNKNMNGNFLNFIDKNKGIYISILLILLLFWVVFSLNRIDMDVYFLSLEIVIFFTLIYTFISFLNFKKELDLKAKIELLKSENSNLKHTMNNYISDLNEYFLMWVHQIKTPITAAKLITENENLDLNLIKTQLFFIEDYTNMAMDYLKISDINNSMDITSIKLDDVIRPILKKYSILFIGNAISLEYYPINDYVISDSKWLSILIEQIISNAVKYTRNGKVSIKYDKEDKKLYISDTGIGIRSEDIPKIFDKGYSGFNGRLNQKSSGLGLFLVKEISKKLSILIYVESKIGEGSNFSIYFQNFQFCKD